MISIICAMDEKRGIGKDNKIPWHIKDDLLKLKSLTKNHVVILGRKTYDSMVGYYDKTGRPMPGKIYLVVTRDANYKPARDNAATVTSVESAIKKAEEQAGEVFVTGGAQIFQQVMHLTDKLYLTIVEGYYNCDTFFPDYSDFRKVISEESRESEGHKYKFLELEK